MVETDSPTNPGDSGGPLVNDKGELVAVTEGGAVNAQLLSTFIDVSEVQHCFPSAEVRRMPVLGRRTDRTAARKEASPTKPRCGRRSRPGRRRHGTRNRSEFATRFGRDLRVETHAGSAGRPNANGVRECPPRIALPISVLGLEERPAHRKGQRHHHPDFPRPEHSLYVNVADAARNVITPEEEQRIREAMLSKFRDHRFDEGWTPRSNLSESRWPSSDLELAQAAAPITPAVSPQNCRPNSHPVAGRQRPASRTAIANSTDKYLAGACHAAAESDHFRIDHVHHVGDRHGQI